MQVLDIHGLELLELLESDLPQDQHFNDLIADRHQNGSTFCVVPIIAAFDQPLPSTFDFWAAGKDCCTSLGENFNCGAADSTSSSSGMARGGLRPLDCYEVSPLLCQWLVDVS